MRVSQIWVVSCYVGSYLLMTCWIMSAPDTDHQLSQDWPGSAPISQQTKNKCQLALAASPSLVSPVRHCRHTPSSKYILYQSSFNVNHIFSAILMLVILDHLPIYYWWVTDPKIIRRKEKVKLAHNQSFRFKLTRSKYWACMSAKFNK